MAHHDDDDDYNENSDDDDDNDDTDNDDYDDGDEISQDNFSNEAGSGAVDSNWFDSLVKKCPLFFLVHRGLRRFKIDEENSNVSNQNKCEEPSILFTIFFLKS